MRGISRVLTGRRLALAIAAVVAAVAGAGGTALALTTSAPSHAVSMSRGGLTRAALKVTAGTPFLDVSIGRLGGTLTGVAGGTVLTPPGWAAATSRFDIDATSGFSQLTVSRWSAAGS